MRIAIVEDERISASALEAAIMEYNPSFEVSSKLETVEEAIEWFSEEKCDLIFMDVELPDGTCFNILDQVEIKTPIVFLTGYNQYAIDAFGVNSLDYILKPLTEEKLARCFKKFIRIEKYYSKNLVFDYHRLEKSIDVAGFKRKFLVQNGNKLTVVSIDEVAYFHAIDRFCFLVLHSGREHLIDHTLAELEDLLNPSEFFRLNRQVMARMECIVDISPYFKSRLKIGLKPDYKKEIIISTSRTRDFRKWANT